MEISWIHVFTILQLIVLEGLLSFDNALALAALVKSRLKDPEERRRALTWGIWGAYVFRVGIVFIGVWLMKFEWVKVVAGLYLVWIAIWALFLEKGADDIAHDVDAPIQRRNWMFLTPFWSTVVSVELMDIMFSIDSIGVALAISDVQWVLITGAMLGILAMRFAAAIFVKLIDRFPVLEKTAFILVGIAGLNVLLKTKDLPLWGTHKLTIDKAMPEHPFIALLMTILIGSMVLNHFFPQWFEKKEHAHPDDILRG